jgi:hypothetical protein
LESSNSSAYLVGRGELVCRHHFLLHRLCVEMRPHLYPSCIANSYDLSMFSLCKLTSNFLFDIDFSLVSSFLLRGHWACNNATQSKKKRGR